MIRVIIIILSFFAITTAIAQKTFTLTVEITDIAILNHKLYVGIYNNENDFSKNTNALDSVIITPSKSVIKVIFKHLAEGEYAIAFFQDLNNDGKLNTGIFGIPTEPVGISNYSTKAKAPPKFRKAMFKISNNMEIKIPLVTPPKDIKENEN